MVDGTSTRTTQREHLNVPDIASNAVFRSLIKKMMPAGNRNKLGITYSTTTAADRTQGMTYWSPKTNGYTDLEVEMDNFMFQPTGAPVTTALTAVDIPKMAVEYPIGGTIYPMYLSEVNGVAKPRTARGVTLQVGDYAKWYTVVKIPRNAQYRIRFQRIYPGAGPNYNTIINMLTHSGKNDGYASGDAVDSGALTLYAAATQVFSPTLVKGTSDVAGVPRVVMIGDSRMSGSGGNTEPWSGTVQGDWISTGFQNVFPYENKGNHSWMEIALGNELPYLNLGIASAQSISFTAAIRAHELRLMQEIDPTHIILDLCINDLLGGTTGAAVLTRITNNIILLRSYFPDAQIFVCTPLPVTNSIDAYATLANQALSGTLAAGGTPSNWALFTDNAGASGRSQVLAGIRNNSVEADGVIDVSAWLSDPTDERYWNSLYGILTGDGIHQNNPGHFRAGQAIDFQKVLF